MSYLVLARKWRPQTFAQVVGQRSVVRTLQNALARDRVAHAMIFSGVRGVGKTTLARIMAKALNCREPADNEPCNRCDSCREITAGTAVDLHEIDGASNRGIQEIRELKENIRFYPSTGRYKIIIIDEVHMLTTEAFNALLKTLEEPPPHVFFMFATTELHKVPITILSRCQRYELKRVPFVELVAFFKRLAVEEGVSIPDNALETIAGEAEGSVRDGLSLLDQIFSFGGDTVTEDDVTQVLGLVDRSVFPALAAALLAGDLDQCLQLLDRCYGAGIDLKRFANDLLAFFRAMLVCKASRDSAALLDMADRDLAIAQALAAPHSAETIYHHLQLLLQGVEAMQYASRPRLVLEMAFIRAAQAGAVTPVAELLARLDDVLRGVTPLPVAPPPGPAAAVAPVQSPPSSMSGGGLTTAEAEPSVGAPVDVAARNQAEPPVSPPAVAPTPAAAPLRQGGGDATAAGSSSVLSARQKEIRRHWEEFIDYVKDRKQWMAHSLRLSSGTKEEDGTLVIKFGAASDCKVLQDPDNMKFLTEFAQDFFQKELRVRLSVRGGAAAGGDGREDPQEERRALANDPLVQLAGEIFGGQVVGIRTGPRSR
ncbi:MAG: DNA polymerase III subunit gamma/tau [Desulfobulbaceae bacterium]|nr:DNA polymerase III subunit gamma/tau [Desulfobulbaceae bacterium]